MTGGEQICIWTTLVAYTCTKGVFINGCIYLEPTKKPTSGPGRWDQASCALTAPRHDVTVALSGLAAQKHEQGFGATFDATRLHCCLLDDATVHIEDAASCGYRYTTATRLACGGGEGSDGGPRSGGSPHLLTLSSQSLCIRRETPTDVRHQHTIAHNHTHTL